MFPADKDTACRQEWLCVRPAGGVNSLGKLLAWQRIVSLQTTILSGESGAV